MEATRRLSLPAMAAALLALLLAAACLVGVMSTKAEAATYSEVSATVVAPLDSAKPTYTAATGTSAYSATVKAWYSGGTVTNPGEELTPVTTFTKGKTYIVEVKFTMASGNQAANYTTIKINGNTGYFYGWSGSVVVGRYAFVAGENPNNIVEPNARVTTPVELANPSYTAIQDGAGFTTEVAKWYRGGTVTSPGTVMAATDTFSYNQTYIVEVKYRANEGKTFASDSRPQVNGNDAYLYGYNSTTLIARYAFTASIDPYAMSALAASVTAPMAPNAPSYVATSPDAGSYSAVVKKWYKGGTVQSPGAVMAAGETFVNDSTYIVEVKLDAASGKKFSGAITSMINGRDSYLYGWSPSSILIRQSFVAGVDESVLFEGNANIDAPMYLANPSYAASTDQHTFNVKLAKWYLGGTVQNPGTVMADTDEFTPGNTYIAEVTFTAREGYSFARDFKPSINGKAALLYGWSDGVVKVRYAFTALEDNPNLIKAVAATVEAPVAGAAPAASATTESSDYTVEVKKWYKGGTMQSPGAVMAEGEKFASDTVYVVELKMTAAEGKKFENYAAVEINGQEGYFYGWSDSVILVRQQFAATGEDPNLIKAVAASLTAPVVGEIPAATASVPSGDYTVEVKKWYKGGTMQSPGAVMAEGEKFEASTVYVVELKMTAAEGKKFKNYAAVKINGQEGYFYGWSDSVILVRQQFTTGEDPNLIKAVSATVEAPVAGAAPAASATTESSDYTVEVKKWYKGGTMQNPGTVMAEGEKFASDTVYVVELKMTAAEGKKFENYAAVKINGQEGYFYGWSDSVILVRQQFTAESDLPYSDLWKSFPDVMKEVNKAGGPDKVWYVADGWLDYVVNAGLMSGYSSNGWFGPYDNITRGQVAVILYRAECAADPALVEQYGSTTDPAKYATSCAFKDMKAREYYTAAVNWAKDAGIMTGDSGTGYTTVRPNDSVARQELCLMLARYANGGTVPSVTLDPTKAEGIKGMNQIASWARDGVYWAVNNGVIGGVNNGDGTFSMDPTGKTWRSAAAKMFTVVMRDVL